MKQWHKERLIADFEQYRKQIGIIDTEVPQLTFDPKEYTRIASEYNSKKSNRVRRNGLGKCYRNARVILVSQNARGSSWEYEKNNKGNRVKRRFNGDIYYKKIKKKVNNYAGYKDTLVHELVHYRWDYRHGEQFDKRIWEILRGRVFPEKSVLQSKTDEKIG